MDDINEIAANVVIIVGSAVLGVLVIMLIKAMVAA